MGPGRALLPADLLVQFEPWRSHVANPPPARWDALVWDGIAQYYPWRLFAAESIRDGVLPLWNPYQFCGTPLLANGQSAVLYPLNAVFWLLPVSAAFAWSAWLHLTLAGWFVYLFLRRMGVGRFGGLCGAVVWQLNGFLVAWLHLPTVMCTATWIPLILLCCDRALTTGRWRYALAGGVALGLSYLGGHPNIFMFVVLLTALYIVTRAVSRSTNLTFGRRVVRLISTGATVGITGLAVTACQLLPTLDLLRISHRSFVPGPESYAFFLDRALPVQQLAGLLIPHPFGHPALGTYVGRGNYAEYSVYVGTVALALAVWAVLTSRQWHTRFFVGASLLTAVIALGTVVNWPLYHWLPGMSRAGGPNRILVLLVFSLAVLAGIGADSFVRYVATRGKSSVIAPLLVLALVPLCAWLWLQFVGAAMPSFNPTIKLMSAAELVRAFLLLAGAVVCMQLARNLRLHRAGQLGLIAILAADLLVAAQHHVHAVPQAWVYPSSAGPTAVSGRIMTNASDWPLHGFPTAVFPPNAATVYGVREVFGYDSLYLSRYRSFASLIQGSDPSPPENGNLLLARLGPVYGLDMMRLAGVETVVSPVAVEGGGLHLEPAEMFYTYHDSGARPRAWVTENAVFAPSDREAFEAIVRLSAAGDCIIITGPDEPASELPQGSRPAVELRDVSPNCVAVDVDWGGGGYLFLADSYAPGWHAYAEAGELRVRVADVAFRAVALPEGTESVTFRYEPSSFRVGVFVSLLALAGALGAAGGMLVLRGEAQ